MYITLLETSNFGSSYVSNFLVSVEKHKQRPSVSFSRRGKVLYLEVFRAFKFLSDKLGETEKLPARLVEGQQHRNANDMQIFYYDIKQVPSTISNEGR